MSELPPPVVDAETARRTAEEVLSQPAYQESEPGWLFRLVSWLFETLAELLASVRSGGLASVVGWIVLAGLVLGSSALAVRATRAMSRDRAVRSTAETEIPDPQHWRERAAAARSAGDHAEAVRCEHRVVETELELRHLVERRRGRTAGELRRQLTAAVPESGPAASELTRLFDRARYGDGADDADAAQAEALRRQIESVLP